MVASQALPARLNAVIRPLMTAVKAEADEALQDCAVTAVVALLPLCAASGRRGVCGKLVRNLCHFVAASVPLDTVPTRTRGASNALRSICGQYGERVWIEFPELHQFVILPLQSATTAAAAQLLPALAVAAALVGALVGKALDAALEVAPAVIRCTCFASEVGDAADAIRDCARRTLSALCVAHASAAMLSVISHLLPLTRADGSGSQRCFAIQAITCVAVTLWSHANMQPAHFRRVLRVL